MSIESAIAAEGIVATPLNYAGTIPAKGVLVLGGAGEGATVTTTDADPGTRRRYKNRTLTNIVISSLEDFGGGQLRVATSLKDCLTAGRYRTINGRSPDFYAGEVDQLVLYNPEAAGIEVSISAEQRWRSSAVNGQGGGSHPGHGTLTIPLGSVDPAAYDADSAPLIARIFRGQYRTWDITRVSVFSAVPIDVTAGTAELDVLDPDGTSILTAPVDLEGLTPATLTDATLVTPGDPGPPEVDWAALAREYYDLVVDLSAYAGSAGDITLEVEYTR